MQEHIRPVERIIMEQVHSRYLRKNVFPAGVFLGVLLITTAILAVVSDFSNTVYKMRTDNKKILHRYWKNFFHR